MQNRVKEFHEKFGCTISEYPSLHDTRERELRYELLREEMEELRLALDSRDIVEVADALGDILYVTLGAGVTFGLDMEKIFTEIHRSNMTKVWPDGSVQVREDGKIMKPDTYQAPDLATVIFAGYDH